MRKSILTLAVAAFIALPGVVAAQSFGVAGRAGTLGIGAEGALAFGSSLVVRGGVGLMPPLRFDPTSFWDVGEGVEATLTLPETWYNVGLDFYLGSSFRLGGGMLYKPDDPTIAGTLTGTASIDIGGVTYTATEVAQVTGALVSKKTAPYALIGFGKHTSTGIGLFLDLGVAMLGEPDVQLNATSTLTGAALVQLNDQLEIEAQNLKNDAGTYLKYWPIINLGLRIGVGN